MKKNLTITELVQMLIQDISQQKLLIKNNKLPSEQQLLTHYGVSRYAIRQTLMQLSFMGYIYQAQGMGAFVRPRWQNQSIALQNNVGLTEEVARQGRVIKTVQAIQKECSVREALFLPTAHQLAPDLPLIEVMRWRTLDDEPYLVERSYYLKEIVGELPTKALYDSLFQYFNQHHAINIGFIDKMIMSEELSKEAATFFHLPESAPALVVRDDTYLSSGKLLTFSKLCYDYRKAQLYMFKKID